MDCVFLTLAILASIVSSYAYETRLIQGFGLRGNSINGYGDSFYDTGRTSFAASNDCYDLCYNAHCSGSRSRVSGCVCSRYDFSGVTFGGGLNQRSRFVNNCNCPIGSYCVNENGRRRCVRRSRSSVNRIGSSYPRNSGLPRNLGGRCGYFSPRCLASQRDLNQQVRFTYDYQLRRCIRERVFTGCTPGGTRNNIFSSLRTCNRMCL